MAKRAIVVWLLVAGWAPWVELRAGSAPAAEDMLEEVVVTASRITRPDYSYSNPVFSVGGDVLRSSGIKDMADYLANVPALVGSVSSTFTSGGEIEGTNGLTALNLRNLGPQRTLVLVNGRRYIGSPFPGAAFVDIDTLPVALIERVEVLTGGASALYGADGVSGVVNFVMKDRFEGLDISMEAGASSKHDAQSRSAALTYGTSIADERGHFSIALTYDEDKHLYHDRRSFTSPSGYSVFVQNPNNPDGLDTLPDQIPLRDIRFAESSRGGALDITFDGFPEFDADGSVWDGGLFIEPFYQQGGDGQPLVEFLSDLLPDEENYTLNTFFDFDITDNLRFFSELAYHRNESYAEFEPIFDFVLVILPDSPFIPANVAAQADIAVLNSKDNWDLGIRTDDTERETYRGVLGLEGEFDDRHSFEVSYTYGETDVEYRTLNQRYNDRFAAAVDVVLDPVSGEPVCRSELDPSAEPFNLAFQEWNNYTPRPGTWAGSFTPGIGDCVPLNNFGDGAPSREAINWVMLDTLGKLNLKQQVAQAFLRGDASQWLALPAGPLQYVVGAEWRKEEVEGHPDDADRLGYTYGNQYEGDRGEIDVTEVFAEVDVPLLSDARYAEYLAVDAAVRYSDYSTIGDATTWKLGLVWQPLSSLTLRATVAEATRSPSIQELFTPAGQTLEFIADPCDINNLDNGSDFRTANCAQLLTDLGVDPSTFLDPNGGAIPGLVGGNEDLQEETADTVTWGLIYTPAFIEGLTISVDWYDIELEDAINYTSPQDAADLCVDLPTFNNNFCNLITRRDDGGIDDFSQRPENVTSFTTRGVDFNISWIGEPQSWGALAVQLSGNKLNELKTVSLPGAPSESLLGQKYAPEWQANLDVEWSLGGATLRWQTHYFDETYRFDQNTLRNNPNIVASKYLEYDSKLTHDLYGSYLFENDVKLYVGVSNLTDESPEIGETFYPVSPVGRYLFAGFEVSL